MSSRAKSKQQLLTDLNKIIDSLFDNIYYERESIFPFTVFREPHGLKDFHGEIPQELYNSEDVALPGDIFKGLDDYLWLTKKINVPMLQDGCDIIGIFDFGCTGPGFNSGFESLLYVNGKPYQGVDTEHKEVNLTKFAGQNVELTFMLWTGLNEGPSKTPLEHILAKADVCYRRNNAFQLFYELTAVRQSIDMIDKSHERLNLLNCAVETCEVLDFENINESSAIALAKLSENYGGIVNKHPATVACVGHTHIDVAWLWRLCHTREKSIRSFSTVMRLMEEYPEFLFLQSQPQLYAFIKKDCPELYEKIAQKIKEGRWESDGAMWLEADCNITSGESLARQLIHGIRFMKNEFGVDSKHLWLPDVFGYSYALPQLLKLAHIDTFLTTKISWNDTNRFPYDLFRWRGIDGSEVLAYFPTTPDPLEPGNPLRNYRTRYNGFMNALTIMGAWKRFRQRDKSNEVLISYGLGDGGGGVTREMLEMRRAIDKIPYMPSVKQTFARDFFERLHNNIKENNHKLPVWDDEIYLELHRGTYTSQAKNKKNNRICENLLYTLEWLNVIATKSGEKSIQDQLNSLWETVLLNQFHDIIPGSSIHEVYEDSSKQYEGLISQAKEFKNQLSRKLILDGREQYTIFNPSPFKSTELVKIFILKEGHFEDAQNNLIPAQKTDNGYLISVDMLPLSATTIKFVEGEQLQDVAFSYSSDLKKISTPYYEVEFNENGQISRLYDKEYSREYFSVENPGNILRLYVDKPRNYDAWDLDSDYVNSYTDFSLKSIKVLQKGSEVLTLEMVYGNDGEIVQNVSFYGRNRRIDFENKISWHESHKLLKVLFPTDIVSDHASFDTQYGYLTRVTHNDNSFEKAKFEVVGHKWANLSDGEFGLSLLNNCKYGYSAKGSLLTLSLLRSPKEPDAFADMGNHEFTYSILPHKGDVAHSDTIYQANALNHKPFYVKGKYLNEGPCEFSCSDPHIQVDAFKVADDGNGYILRLHEAFGSTSKFKITFPFEISGWCVCDLLEAPQQDVNALSEIEDTLTPFTIRTYRIYL